MLESFWEFIHRLRGGDEDDEDEDEDADEENIGVAGCCKMGSANAYC